MDVEECMQIWRCVDVITVHVHVYILLLLTDGGIVQEFEKTVTMQTSIIWKLTDPVLLGKKMKWLISQSLSH